jgi:hypothetical protein
MQHSWEFRAILSTAHTRSQGLCTWKVHLQRQGRITGRPKGVRCEAQIARCLKQWQASWAQLRSMRHRVCWMRSCYPRYPGPGVRQLQAGPEVEGALESIVGSIDNI